MMIRTVLRRRDDVWASMKTGCLHVLRRVCVRIRWRHHADLASYNILGFSRCLSMRILILLLEKKLLLHSVSVKSGFAKLLTKSEARLLRRVLVSCARGSKQEPCYFELLYYRIRQCCQSDDNTASYTLLCAHGMSLAGDDQRVLLVDELHSRIPAHILDAPFQKFICWTCHKQCDPCCVCSADALRYCGGCKLARYCSASCQRLDWNLHKRRCTSFLAIARDFKAASAAYRNTFPCVKTLRSWIVHRTLRTERETVRLWSPYVRRDCDTDYTCTGGNNSDSE